MPEHSSWILEDLLASLTGFWGFLALLTDIFLRSFDHFSLIFEGFVTDILEELSLVLEEIFSISYWFLRVFSLIIFEILFLTESWRFCFSPILLCLQFLQGIPRTVTLDSKTDVSFIQWPIEEVNALRGAKLSMTELQLDAGAVVEVESAAAGQVWAQKIPELKGLSLTSHLSIFYCSNMNFSSGIQKRLIVSNFLKHPSKSSKFPRLWHSLFCWLNGLMCSWMLR